MLIISAIICYALCKTIWHEIMNDSNCEEDNSSSNLFTPSQGKCTYTVTKNKTTSATRL
jgi:hypothetical protein